MTDVALCVYCRKHPIEQRFRPFCSERCQLLDLGAWVDGRYRVASTPTPEDEDAESVDDDETGGDT